VFFCFCKNDKISSNVFLNFSILSEIEVIISKTSLAFSSLSLVTSSRRVRRFIKLG